MDAGGHGWTWVDVGGRGSTRVDMGGSSGWGGCEDPNSCCRAGTAILHRPGSVQNILPHVLRYPRPWGVWDLGESKGGRYPHQDKQTPAQTPGQTPGQTPAQTPGQTPAQTPAQTPGQMPAQTAVARRGRACRSTWRRSARLWKRPQGSTATTTAAVAPAVHSSRHWTRMNPQANAGTLGNRTGDRTARAARGGRSPEPWGRGAPLRPDAARGVWFPPARPQKPTRTENAESSIFTTALVSSFVLSAPGDSTVPTEDQTLSSRQTGNLHKIRVV